MKKIRLAELLSAVTVAGVAVVLTSCGGGGGGGNGMSQSGFYQLYVDGAPQNAVYSVDPSSLSIPLDTWQFTAIFNATSGASSSSAIITSASLCVQEPGLSVSCMPISFTNPVITNGNEVTTTAQFNFYKLGQYALEANPYQDLQVSQESSSVPAFILPDGSTVETSYSSGSATPAYASSFYLSNSLVPGTVNISFSYNMPATVIVSSTTLSSTSTNSSTAGSNSVTSSTSSGTYNVSGICVDNGNGGFNTVSSDTGITCSGSIQYSSGYITNFSISQNQSATISITAVAINSSSSGSLNGSTSSTSTNSSTVVTVTTYIIKAGASDSVTPSLSASYLYSNGTVSSSNITSNTIYAYLPPVMTYSATSGLYISTSAIPQSIVVVIPSTTSTTSGTSTSSGTTTTSTGSTGTTTTTTSTSSQTIVYSCNSSGVVCNISNGVFSATLPSSDAVSASDIITLNVLYNTFYTYNPDIYITSHTTVATIPYTVTATINVDGSTMTANYNGILTVESP